MTTLDVALVPGEARRWSPRVCIVIDELRASSTITAWLDLGCPRLHVTRSLAEARRLAREHGAVLAGERHGIMPAGFDVGNSPTALHRADVRGRPGVLSTSNGTAVLRRVEHMPVVLVGCLLNARACAEAALERATGLGLDVGIVCAGLLGRFALDDAYAAGVICDRLVEAAARVGVRVALTDAALAARRLAVADPDADAVLAGSWSGRLVTRIGEGDDVPFCARVDSTATVPILRSGTPLLVEPLVSGGARSVPRARA